MNVRTPKVVDFSTHWSGPMASRQLVQLGADVVKIEAPRHGDGNRGVPPLLDGESVFHAYLGAGTRSLVADVRSQGWPELVAAAARWADVVIVGNRPQSARRRGLDFGSIRQHRPDTVYCQVTGYGLAGPWAGFPAHGLQMDALAGSVPVEDLDGHPAPPATMRSVGTTLAGIEAALGVLAGLHRRDAGLGAQYVHVSIWESALAWMWRDLTVLTALGRPWDNYRDFGSRYCMYRAADGGVALVCPTERHFWERFCAILGLSDEVARRGDWANGIDYGAAYPGERELVQASFARRPLGEWAEAFVAADVPFAPVLDIVQAYDSEHAEANGASVTFEYRGQRTRIPTTPVSVSAIGPDAAADASALAAHHRAKGRDLGPPPALGEHTAEILSLFGIPELGARLHAPQGGA